jgi:hypothetical protein
VGRIFQTARPAETSIAAEAASGLILALHLCPLALLSFTANLLEIGQRRIAALLRDFHGMLDVGPRLLRHLSQKARKHFAVLPGCLLDAIEGLFTLASDPWNPPRFMA